MKQQIRISLIPLYRCNMNCEYCIFKQYLKSVDTLNLVTADNLLNLLETKFDINQINISGGEISLLSDFYFDMLYNLCKSYCKKINIFTNFTNFNKAIINRCDVINVNYNFNGFSKNINDTISNIKAATDINKIINIKSLDISCECNPLSVINQLNNLNIKSWEIIPYHQTEYTNIKFTDYNYFENTVKNYLKYVNRMKFAFQNKLQLDNVLPIDNYNIKIVYILPNGNLGLQKFENNLFSIEEFNSFEKFIKKFEENEKKLDNFCKNCTSKIQCMANYFLNLNYNKVSCSGFKNLILEYNKDKQ